MSKMDLEDYLTAVQVCDDRIGRYSDHEGDENGPTFYHWKKGMEGFMDHCDRAIADHYEAVMVWRKFKRFAEGHRRRTTADKDTSRGTE